MLLLVADDLAAGEVALVTGGGRGIGAGIARELAEVGKRVAVAARSVEQVEQVAQQIRRVAVQADVSDEASVAAIVARVEREPGRIGVLD